MTIKPGWKPKTDGPLPWTTKEQSYSWAPSDPRREQIKKHLAGTPDDHDQQTHAPDRSPLRRSPIHREISEFDEILAGRRNTMSALPDDLQTRVREQVDKWFGSRRNVRRRYRRIAELAAQNPTAMEWRDWYEDTHDWHQRLAERTHLEVEGLIAATSAMSPGREWSLNMKATETLALFLDREKPVTLGSLGMDLEHLQGRLDDYADKYDFARVVVNSETTLYDIPEPNLAAVAFGDMAKKMNRALGFQYGYSTAGDAISLLRDGAAPTNILRGVKTRSFYNNMLALPNDDDVTVDFQMFEGAYRSATQIIPLPKGVESKMVGTPSISRVGEGKTDVGVRPLLADEIRRLTDELNGGDIAHPWGPNLLPRQVQAILWNQIKEQKK